MSLGTIFDASLTRPTRAVQALVLMGGGARTEGPRDHGRERGRKMPTGLQGRCTRD